MVSLGQDTTGPQNWQVTSHLVGVRRVNRLWSHIVQREDCDSAIIWGGFSVNEYLIPCGDVVRQASLVVLDMRGHLPLKLKVTDACGPCDTSRSCSNHLFPSSNVAHAGCRHGNTHQILLQVTFAVSLQSASRPRLPPVKVTPSGGFTFFCIAKPSSTQ